MQKRSRTLRFVTHTLGACAALAMVTACGGDSENNDANNTNNTTNNSNNATNNATNNSTNNVTNNDTNNVTNNETNNATNNSGGRASLSFKPTFGSNFGNQLPAAWRAPLGIQNEGDAPVVVMLCAMADETCEDPVEVVEVDTGGLIQSSFGPDVTVEDLPVGDYRFMVFMDSERSRERGLGWRDTPEKTIETAWGGHVSEFDIMLSDPDESPGAWSNPAPAPLSISLVEGETTALGTLRLAHFHERRVDPVPETEEGAIAVVTQTGLRLIDLNTFELADAGGGFLDFFLVDDSGNDLSDRGRVCGMIEGPNDIVYVMYADPSGGGFAVPFDVRERAQIGDGAVIEFPGSGTPCQGVYHDANDAPLLVAINIGASGIAQGEEGIWFADMGDFGQQEVVARRFDRNTDPILAPGANAIVSAGDRLYLSMTPEDSDSSFVPADTVGFHTVVAIETRDGIEFKDDQGDYTYWTPLPTRDGVTQPDGDIDCVTPDRNGGAFAGLFAAPFHDGRELLFVGGCSRIAVIDAGTGERVDMAPDNPRSMDIDATLFGHGYTRFALSPDEDVLYVLPQYKSQFHFFFKKDNDDSSRQTFNRYMVLPLALDSGAVPALHEDFTGEDIDGHAGETNIGDRVTPAADPGIDINVAHLTRYQVDWSGSLAGSTNQSGSIPVGPSLAAGVNTMWIRGSGIQGVSGLGKGSNLMSYSIAERRAHLWPHDTQKYGWDYYRIWQGGNEADAPFGYDLTPNSSDDLATYGVVYVDLR